MSPTVVHSTVLAVRNFVDDITGWGWAERLARQLIFAGDVQRLPRPLPRVLAPGDDARLMAAVTELDDPFARCGLKLLRGPASGSANCSTSNSAASSTTARPAPG